MRRFTPVPSSQSREVLVLESPEAFADALLARPPRADENHLIARERGESLRRFALRTLHRLRRTRADPRQVLRISYLFRGGASEENVRSRFLKALAALASCGSLSLVAPSEATETLFRCLGALHLPLAGGAVLEAELSPTGWTILSARSR